MLEKKCWSGSEDLCDNYSQELIDYTIDLEDKTKRFYKKDFINCESDAIKYIFENQKSYITAAGIIQKYLLTPTYLRSLPDELCYYSGMQLLHKDFIDNDIAKVFQLSGTFYVMELGYYNVLITKQVFSEGRLLKQIEGDSGANIFKVITNTWDDFKLQETLIEAVQKEEREGVSE